MTHTHTCRNYNNNTHVKSVSDQANKTSKTQIETKNVPCGVIMWENEKRLSQKDGIINGREQKSQQSEQTTKTYTHTHSVTINILRERAKATESVNGTRQKMRILLLNELYIDNELSLTKSNYCNNRLQKSFRSHF